MTGLLSGTRAVRTSGALVVAGAALSGPAAMFVVAGVAPQLSIVGAVCTAIFDRWVFSTAGLVSFAGWNLLVGTCFLLIAMTSGGGIARRASGAVCPVD